MSVYPWPGSFSRPGTGFSDSTWTSGAWIWSTPERARSSTWRTGSSRASFRRREPSRPPPIFPEWSSRTPSWSASPHPWGTTWSPTSPWSSTRPRASPPPSGRGRLSFWRAPPSREPPRRRCSPFSKNGGSRWDGSTSSVTPPSGRILATRSSPPGRSPRS